MAKALLYSNLYNPSAKADGNKKAFKLELIHKLPFTLVNGFIEYR